MKRRRWITTGLLVLVMLTGLGLLLYPTVSDQWNRMHTARAITDYNDQLVTMDNDSYGKMLREAVAYNQELTDRHVRYALPEDMTGLYDGTLNINDTGIMGYISLPSIDVQLPIYHGTDEGVLQIAVGHLDWTHLPVGGAGTHCVLSGHRGLPSARLFTDLDKLTEGDTFSLHVLDEELSYEIDRILIVEPTEIQALLPEPGKDLCTLVTCTPYGVNSHRLLVRGHRVVGEAGEEAISYYHVQANAVMIRPAVVAPVLAAPMLLILFLWALWRAGRGREDSVEELLEQTRREEEP